MRFDLRDRLSETLEAPGANLARAALIIARIEYPDLDPEPYLSRLDAMGDRAARLMQQDPPPADREDVPASVRCLNTYLFEHERFVGNRDHYEDPRNSCLNEVLDRRTGIPITLSLVYMEIAHRVGMRAEGVNFPGHFLVRCQSRGAGHIVDPFHAGAVLSEHDCRRMLQKHVGSEIAFHRELLAPATPSQIVIRMLLNLKRIYVHMRSFPQARDVTELLLALSPSALSELRDRGLLSYHVSDYSSALRDLQMYLTLSAMSDLDEEGREEREQIWEHVKTLRRRVASFN